MITLQNVFTWLFAIVILTVLLPGSSAGLLGRCQQWPLERTRRVARWLAVALSITWWVVAVYRLNMAFPYDWIGATIATPARVLAFTVWCLAPGYFAPLMAEKLNRA